jgi:glutamate transport system ATP-binding protein
MATDIVSVEGLHKRFGDLHVLKGVSLKVGGGEVIVVLGRSGSGKSTLLRCINWLEEPTEGTIEVDGIRLEAGHLSRARRDLVRRIRLRTGMVFQEFNLFPHMTVLRNVMEAPITVKDVPTWDAEEKARELLAKVGLAEKADEYPIRLSGGQKQRVAIARALAMDPKVMLFDEPTSALDPELIGEVLNVMRDLAKEGMTMLVVTHEMGFARRAAHRVVFMSDGEIVEDAAPDTFFSSPTSDRAKDFLGKILTH